MRFFFFTLLVFCSFYTAQAQNSKDIALEFQAYPTGIIPGISLDYNFGLKNVAYARIGFNFFDHRDLGKKDEESGSGYGFSLGYKYYFKEGRRGWRIGIKNDIWKNEVNWENEGEEGLTEILVVQPTAELSYVWLKNNFVISPSLAFGLEWNVDTKGEPTGEGPIVLIGIQVGQRF